MILSMSFEVLAATRIEPPAGFVSPIAWVIIGALVAVITVTVPALWFRGNTMQDKMYEDLKKCNEDRAKSEEDLLGLMKVLRLQMEQSKGGRKG